MKKDIHKVRFENLIKKELKLLGSLNPQRGHKCFEVNTITNEVSEAEFFEDYVAMFSSSYERKKKLRVKENCVYITALNKKNAIKKYNSL
jgi:hypothetical protein